MKKALSWLLALLLSLSVLSIGAAESSDWSYMDAGSGVLLRSYIGK